MRFLAAILWIFLTLNVAAAQQSLLSIQRIWANNPTSESTDCIQVGADGSYHFEHTPMSLGQAERREIHVGKLSGEEMKELQAILDDPALQLLNTPTTARIFAPDFDMLWVSIDRAHNRQTLFFESAAGENTSSTGVRPRSLIQTPAMKPLMSWYKQISKRKGDIDKTATATCSLDIRRR